MHIAIFIGVAILLIGFALFIFFSQFGRKLLAGRSHPPHLERFQNNPILSPIQSHWWESEAVFNPATWYDGSRVHMLYRALGKDGVSRIGYASSSDGIHFDRLPYPVFSPDGVLDIMKHRRCTSPARLTYDTVNNPSGGGWGGSEDPRMVNIDGIVYVTFNMFNGWNSMRIGLLTIDENDMKHGIWNWKFSVLSAPGRHKNWALFPEKINGKFALFHNLFHANPSRVCVNYFDKVELPDHLPPFESPDPQRAPNRILGWHHRTRSIGAPPIKTEDGWLVLYHAMDKDDPERYKVGALMLDLKDPTKVLYRSVRPILEPDMWYENDWKPGIVYTTGAVIKGDELLVYYGGGDKHIAAAHTNLHDFLHSLKTHQPVKLKEAVV